MLQLTPPVFAATVFVVDQDASVRAALEPVIRRAGWRFEGLSTAESILSRRRLADPSCLVLDIATQDPSDFDHVRRIAAAHRATPVIAVANRGDIPMTVRAMRAGAVDFLTKPVANEDMLSAIRQAIAHSRDVLGREAGLLELRRRYDSLSGREREVMARVVAGLLNKRVGAALGISEITVKTHRGNAMRKMRADSLAELVVMGIRLELPPVPAALPPRYQGVGDTIGSWPNTTPMEDCLCASATSQPRTRCTQHFFQESSR